MKMKKVLLTAAVLTSATLAFGGNGWLSDVASTVDNISSVAGGDGLVNQTTIYEVLNSGSKYVNRRVQVKGKVTALAVTETEGIYMVTVTDDSGNSIKVKVSASPFFRLMQSVTVFGTYNGKLLENGKVW